ncbi:TRAP transporter small permease [Salipiger mucosus]|uniref:TRAP transporter small permease protein n=1 Tax=Salipiger mucosus DSM 16094 TaxID=1123237 RepID=S9RNE5_9RHOB|nr:TRAP transporter small permease [Salipiger mucosus]EPX75504.1 Tripartite ATP-independent periplasmic transporter, DctQ component [Salipiger mucosus DSM 16094]
MMTRLRRILDGGVGYSACLILMAMVAVLVWQVFSRYVLNAPSTSSEELLRYGMIWSSLLGAAFAAGRGTHMSVELLPGMAPPRVRRLLGLLVPLSFIVFAVAVLIIGGFRAVSVAGTQTSPVMQIPMQWVYAAMPVSGLLIVIYSLLNLVERIAGRRDEADEFEKALAAGD